MGSATLARAPNTASMKHHFRASQLSMSDPALAEPSAQMVVVITHATGELGRIASPRPTSRSDRRYRANQRLQGWLFEAGSVRGRNLDPVGDIADLGASLVSVGAIRACQLATVRARMWAESMAHLD